MNFYWLRNCLRRPLGFILIILSVGLLALLAVQNLADHDRDRESHSATLTRRKASEYVASKGNNNRNEFPKYEVLSYATGPHSTNSDTIDNLMLRIEDLKRIKLSVSNEITELSREKTRILREKANLISRNEKLLSLIQKSKIQLKQLELDIAANRRQKFEQLCDSERVAPILFKPMQSADIRDFTMPTTMTMATLNDSAPKTANVKSAPNYGFEFSFCPLSKPFTVSYLKHEDTGARSTDEQISNVDMSMLGELIRSRKDFNSNETDACLAIGVVDSYRSASAPRTRNNLMIDLSDDYAKTNLSSHAAIASPKFALGHFRSHIDLVIPSIWQPPKNFNSLTSSIPPHSPLERKYLAAYFGTTSGELSKPEQILQIIHRNSIDDLFLFIYNCGPYTNQQCYDEREKILSSSTFLIILPSPQYDIDENTNDSIYLALSRGTVPVILKEHQVRLPFDEVIDWRRACIILPQDRLPELHFILRSMSMADLYSYKDRGRHIFENYLATSKQIIDTIISFVSIQRLNYPPPPVQNIAANIYYSSNQLLLDVNCTSKACIETKTDSLTNLLLGEIYGPREKPFASQSFGRNLSLVLSFNYDLWNNPLYSPKYLFPSLPNDPMMPSEHKFLSPDHGFRPIGDGLGGSGYEFSRALGGDYPNEQFTIVLPTYERKALLMKTLERLKNLAYLNKIVVIWNSIHQPPSENMIWPDVGAPIVVVKPEANSLNNRFLPYDVIETDAIFSMDDDSPLRPDEIIFGFRVWRQSRDRIVGFPGRYHAWDSTQNAWMYNSNHSCELSMVLTGGAFFHRYYSYIYSFEMPQAIRSIVDKFMNCEDIAMNFLVAHLTRKPPIKVTSRWTFHCANCMSSLSEDDSHFRERHECLNIFASIYGYMPLLNTQHRSDSILFKTRLPHDKQKCYKFV